MSQLQRRSITAAPAPPALSPLEVRPAPGQVRLIAGADVQDLALAGRTVGEARLVAQTVFGTRADARAFVNGREVGEDVTLEAGQQLEFTKRAGQKGGPAAIEVTGDSAAWQPNGGAPVRVPLTDLLARVADAGEPPERWRVTPPHVRLMVERQRGRVVGTVIEMPPGPRRVAWMTDDSPVPHGPRARFVEQTLGFPWVVLLVVFVGGELSGIQQAFYRTRPLGGLDDELLFTNLLNVARGYELESWMCLANLTRPLGRLTWADRIRAVTDHFWQAAYTRSSEENEGNSFWQQPAVDKRLRSAEVWAAATRADPSFTLRVPWRRAPEPLAATLARMLDHVAPWRPIERAEQLVTLLQQDRR